MVTSEYLKSGSVWYYEGLCYKVKGPGIVGAHDRGFYGIIDWYGESMIQVTTYVFGKEVKSTLLFEDMEPSKI